MTSKNQNLQNMKHEIEKTFCFKFYLEQATVGPKMLNLSNFQFTSTSAS